MKFRPRIQLQVRSIEQHDRMKAIAGPVSLNEWILQAVESAFPGVREIEPEPEVRTVKPKAKANA